MDSKRAFVFVLLSFCFIYYDLIISICCLVYPGLSIGCMNTLILHGSAEQKKTYLTKLAEGTWMGTMCLTEPQCGTDLSQVNLLLVLLQRRTKKN